MLVVADTSPLNYLVWIAQADLLPQLYERVLLPSAVHRELLDSRAPAVTRHWANHLPGWAEVVEPAPQFLGDAAWMDLGAGERAALAVAAARQPIFLLVDEYAARRVAQERGFLVTGTLGVLDLAARRNSVCFADAIAKLKDTSFRYPKSLVDELLAEHAKAGGEPEEILGGHLVAAASDAVEIATGALVDEEAAWVRAA
ncbi:MAG: DUF3368 domain-containing protein [Bryobacterales bacterium]|nr:DUF3368 domain-containing protein [Bryobacterales bacterium]